MNVAMPMLDLDFDEEVKFVMLHNELPESYKGLVKEILKTAMYSDDYKLAVLERRASHNKIDPKIREIILYLNKFGYRTAYSCQGSLYHINSYGLSFAIPDFHNIFSYIVFKKKYVELEQLIKKKLPYVSFTDLMYGARSVSTDSSTYNLNFLCDMRDLVIQIRDFAIPSEELNKVGTSDDLELQSC